MHYGRGRFHERGGAGNVGRGHIIENEGPSNQSFRRGRGQSNQRAGARNVGRGHIIENEGPPNQSLRGGRGQNNNSKLSQSQRGRGQQPFRGNTKQVALNTAANVTKESNVEKADNIQNKQVDNHVKNEPNTDIGGNSNDATKTSTSNKDQEAEETPTLILYSQLEPKPSTSKKESEETVNSDTDESSDGEIDYCKYCKKNFPSAKVLSVSTVTD